MAGGGRGVVLDPPKWGEILIFFYLIFEFFGKKFLIGTFNEECEYLNEMQTSLFGYEKKKKKCLEAALYLWATWPPSRSRSV